MEKKMSWAELGLRSKNYPAEIKQNIAPFLRMNGFIRREKKNACVKSQRESDWSANEDSMRVVIILLKSDREWWLERPDVSRLKGWWGGEVSQRADPTLRMSQETSKEGTIQTLSNHGSSILKSRGLFSQWWGFMKKTAGQVLKNYYESMGVDSHLHR